MWAGVLINTDKLRLISRSLLEALPMVLHSWIVLLVMVVRLAHVVLIHCLQVV